MTGLRARQKADRGRRMLEAATSLFKEMGYDAARIEDMAQIAGVSVGTFYNYFENKGDLLLATVTMEVEEVLSSGESIVRDPPDDVGLALDRLIGQYYDHSLVWLSKEMWRTAMALSILKPETTFSRRYTELDGRLSAQISALFDTLRRRGRIRADIDVTAVGEMVFNNLNMMFIEFVKDEAADVETLKSDVSRQNRPLARLIAVEGPH